MQNSNGETASIDKILREIKPLLMPKFVNKWAKHNHDVSDCSFTITIDGCWKIYRAKCAQDIDEIVSKEFGNIVTGLSRIASLGSYFCEEHKDFKLKFSDGTNQVFFRPADIKLQILGNILIN